MNIKEVFDLISDISFILLAISPTIFVFGVTLLGTAIEKARQEEKAARDNEATKIKSDIEGIEKDLDQAKKNGNITELTNKLGELKKRQATTDKKIAEIRNKYNGEYPLTTSMGLL